MSNSSLIATAQPNPRSIMCYPLPASNMKDGIAVPGGGDINTTDANFAALVYPKLLDRYVAPSGHTDQHW